MTDIRSHPVAGVAVTLASQGTAARTTTVFTDEAGRYRFPDLLNDILSENLRLQTRRIGWEEAARETDSRAETLIVDFRMKQVENLASQAPASAWLATLPRGPSRTALVKECVDCHQFPTPKIRAIAEALAAEPESVRREEWRSLIIQMNTRLLQFGPDRPRFASNPGLREILESGELGYFNRALQERASAFLASSLPSRFDRLTDAEYRDTTPIGIRGTVMKEYELPTRGWARELAVSDGSSYVWGVLSDEDALVRLDPRSGTVETVKIPLRVPSGPHTIAPDAEGALWVSLEETASVAKFDPRSASWKFFSALSRTPNAVSHDMALDSDRCVAFDVRGRLWVTITSANTLASLDPESGAVAEYELPKIDSEFGNQPAVYGAVMTSDRKHVWFTQVNGILGSFNTETGLVETEVPFPYGTGPRRLAVDANDVLWVPLYGAGQLLAYDTRARREIGRFDLPDRNAAPYSVTWDPDRKVVWVGTSNADRIYRFDPATRSFTQYPTPRSNAFLRMIAIDAAGQIWTTYASLPTGTEPNVFLMLAPGEP